MGITLVQKSDLKHPKKNPKIALVLAGGAITGGAFKLGGLHALNRFMRNRRIVDFDLFVGTSAGSFLATYLANGIETGDLVKSLEGRPSAVDPIMLSEFYAINFKDFLTAPTHLVEHLATMVFKGTFDFLKTNNLFRKQFRKRVVRMLLRPNYDNIRQFVQYCLFTEKTTSGQAAFPWHFLPGGVFTTDKFERSTRKNLAKNDLCNDFQALYEKSGKSLYITAMDLNSARRRVFGPDERDSVPISKAMQASIALPMFYKPVAIDGNTYIDGGMIKTASIDVAIAKGADLIICYNPFRPFDQQSYEAKHPDRKDRINIADDGIYAVFNQVIRTLLHTRLMNGIRIWQKDPDFKGDIVLLEPTEYDAVFFDMNPLAFWERRRAAKRGYASVRDSIGARYDELARLFAAYGIYVDPEFKTNAVQTAV